MTQQTNSFQPDCLATLIGSIPVTDCTSALELIDRYTPQIPLWPQLPSNPLEGMMNQFIEGLPGIVEEGNKTFFNIEYDTFEEDMLKFYEEYLVVSENLSLTKNSRFVVSKERAQGIYRLKEEYHGKQKDFTAIKGQITGPFTLLTGLFDQNKRLGFYNPTFREMAVKTLAMKAAWQVELLKELEVPTIVFIDEPALAGLGSSAFISIDKKDIAQDLAEVIAAIKQAGGIAGIHVCANTDWSMLLTLDLDILSFDAYCYFDKLLTCKDLVHSFLDKGGNIAWGLIPTAEAEAIEKESADSLIALWETQADQLAGGDWDKKALFSRCLITPSCGTGSLQFKHAEKVLQMTRDLSAGLRERYL